MTLELAFSALFAACAAISLACFGAALVERARRLVLLGILWMIACMATAAWVAFALRPTLALAVSAGGLVACVAVQAGSLVALRESARRHRANEELFAAEKRIRSLIKRGTAESTAELERTLARTRADWLSQIASDERKITEERRRLISEQETRGRAELASTLASVQRQVEGRLGEWTDDLQRVQDSLAAELEGLLERQRALLAEVEGRSRADTERIAAESEEHRAALARLRDEAQHAVDAAAATAAEELDTHAAERRRALHEVGERLRQREKSLAEQIEQQETEAIRRIQAGFADVERRQIEALDRVVSRAAASYSDAAAQQFAEQIKSAREDAARRLGRELERAVAAFERQAATVLAERLASVSEAGGQRVERRFAELTASLDRQREDVLAAFEQRLLSAEGELRRRLETLSADIEAERAVIEARLSELARRVENTLVR